MISDPEAAADKAFDLADFDAVVFSDTGKPRYLPRKLQVFAGVVVVVAHFGFWWLLQWGSRPDVPSEKYEDALLIDFITRRPPAAHALPSTSGRVAKVRVRISPQASSRVSMAKAQASVAVAPPSAATTIPALQLYNDDGSVRISAEVLAGLEKIRSEERSFDFQQPGLERAAKLLQRRSPLEYHATSFDKDWQPSEDLLTELLNRAVEASTKEVRIPIPGDPRHHVVCRISFLAMGGGCGVERNGADGDILPGHDDPATLSPEESRACQSWWDKIIAAKTQDDWRRTRKLYDQECRKPLAREPVMPP